VRLKECSNTGKTEDWKNAVILERQYDRKNAVIPEKSSNTGKKL
jgi:hypothetical protein